MATRTLRRIPAQRDPWDTLRPPQVEWENHGPITHEVREDAWREIGSPTWKESPRPLRDAISSLWTKGGEAVAISLVSKHIKGALFDYGDNGRPSWHEDIGQKLTIFPGIAERPLLDGGLSWQEGKGEVRVLGCDFTTEPGGATALGSAGASGVFRLHDCRLVSPTDPKLLASYGGTGIKWGARMYECGLHLDMCDWTAPVQEHSCYLDNPSMLACVDTRFGKSGHTSFQTGTRIDTAEQYGQPGRWLGVLVWNCRTDGLHAGAGGGSALTVWGYPGPIRIKGYKLVSNEVGNMAENRAFSIYRAYNWGGIIDLDHDGYANELFSVEDLVIDYPDMQRGAGEVESLERGYIGTITGNCPKLRIDSPDQWPSGPVGGLYKIPGTSPCPAQGWTGSKWVSVPYQEA